MVLIEAAGDAAAGVVHGRDVAELLEALDRSQYSGALHSSDRYAVQVRAEAGAPDEALSDVLRRWSEATRRLGLPVWEIVRTEVLTPDELERDLEMGTVGPHRDTERTPGPGHQDPVGDQLLREAFSDPLTGLLGREALVHRVHAALADADGTLPVGLVCLHLDDFQQVNARVGPSTGDRLLIAIAHRLSSVLRSGDLLARSGGDEYTALLAATDEARAGTVASRLVREACRPVIVDDEEFVLSASAGVAVSRAGDDADRLLERAKAALDQAHTAGGGITS